MKLFNLLILLFSVTPLLNSQCIKGNCIDGFGKYKFNDKSIYEGKFVNGNMHGKGALTFSEGKYIGHFKKNKREGEGKIIYNTGDSYIGQFKKNLFHGKGKFTYSNGDVYKGHWSDGKKEGYGTYIFNNSDIYKGHFVNDKINGEGILTKANNTHQSGQWYNGTLLFENDKANESISNTDNSVQTLINCNEQDCNNVKGKYTYSDGSYYEGMFVNNQPEGEGICFYSNGSKYTGGWKNHSPHGIGVMTFTSGKKYGAEWNYGNPIRQITDNKLLNFDSAKKKKKSRFDEEVEIYACIIGIASYTHMPSLKYTDDDAYQVYAFLKSPEGGALKDDNIKILIDDAATKNNVLYELKDICDQADANDVVLVYLSGHGLQGSYIPSDFDGYNNSIPYADILSIVDESSAKHKVCIADACHSGSMYAAKSIKTQGLEAYYSNFNELDGGTAFLTSSKSEEVSLEYSGLRHGVFSHFLIEGLKGNADSNNNEIVTLFELYKFIYKNVQEYTNYNQTPTLTGNYNPDMPLSNNYTNIRKEKI